MTNDPNNASLDRKLNSRDEALEVRSSPHAVTCTEPSQIPLMPCASIWRLEAEGGL